MLHLLSSPPSILFGRSDTVNIQCRPIATVSFISPQKTGPKATNKACSTIRRQDDTTTRRLMETLREETSPFVGLEQFRLSRWRSLRITHGGIHQRSKKAREFVYPTGCIPPSKPKEGHVNDIPAYEPQSRMPSNSRTKGTHGSCRSEHLTEVAPVSRGQHRENGLG